jgi:hypothetical protein
MAGSTIVKNGAFDDHHIRWCKLGDFEHFVFSMFEVDEQRKIVDLILKPSRTSASFFTATSR